MFDHEDEQRSKKEKDKRITHEPIREASAARGREIFLHGHRPHVAGSAPVEISGAGVMDCVFPAPVGVRRERQNSGDAPDEIVRAARVEVRTMRAVMKDDEDAHEESSGQHR